jgi:hypothetical protein
MRYNPHPPYEILQNKLIDFATLQQLRRYARYWDIVGNSGNFVETTPLIWSADQASPFYAFRRFSDWLHGRARRTDAIALVRLMELLFQFLAEELQLDARNIATALWRDYQRGGRRDKPEFLRHWLVDEAPLMPVRQAKATLPKRQARHLV